MHTARWELPKLWEVDTPDYFSVLSTGMLICSVNACPGLGLRSCRQALSIQFSSTGQPCPGTPAFFNATNKQVHFKVTKGYLFRSLGCLLTTSTFLVNKWVPILISRMLTNFKFHERLQSGETRVNQESWWENRVEHRVIWLSLMASPGQGCWEKVMIFPLSSEKQLIIAAKHLISTIQSRENPKVARFSHGCWINWTGRNFIFIY